MKKFKEKGMMVSIISIVILLTITLLINTFVLYKEAKEFNDIKGMASDQFHDTMFSFYQIEESGNKTPMETIPLGKSWNVSALCNNGAKGSWDTLNWGPSITNLTESKTKCSFTFEKLKGLAMFGIKDSIVTSGVGIYEVPHSDALIGTHMNTAQTANLKQTEYRYAGQNPNNYVQFNNELWRIIGLVNTPEGSRVKLIRNESIGFNRFSSILNNNWNTSSLQTELNDVYFNTLTAHSKSMIDTITWNLGGINIYETEETGLATHFYNYERGNVVYPGNDFLWEGKVGLMNISDYAYATSGSNSFPRNSCMSKKLFDWGNLYADCKNNDWLYNGKTSWTMNSHQILEPNVFIVFNNGAITTDVTNVSFYYTYPSIYFNSSFNVIKGDGTVTSPYEFGI